MLNKLGPGYVIETDFKVKHIEGGAKIRKLMQGGTLPNAIIELFSNVHLTREHTYWSINSNKIPDLVISPKEWHQSV